MSVNERPGVYSSYEVSSALYGNGGGRAVGVAACSAGGTKGAVQQVSNYTAAAAAYGPESNLTKLIKILLQNGVSAVYAVPVAVNGAAGKTEYTAAFTALMEIPEIGYMICDSREQEIHGAMLSAISGGDEKSKYRIGIAEAIGDVTALCNHAAALNSERMVLMAGCEKGATAGSTAAAVAGVLSAQTDPALPLGGAELLGLGAPEQKFSDNDVNTLVQSGVSPVESLGETVCVIRGVTTRTKTGGVNDRTWRDLTTILIVDTVLPGIRDSLRARFARAKNTAQSRGAIRTQVVIELERYRTAEIIDGYSQVAVQADESDPAVCCVSFAFQVAHGLNRIELVAHITV